jgi:RimJ/RimL family protein N-acetyltransferase
MIYGERIRLRSVEREDLPRFVEWFNDPEVRQYMGRALPMSLEEEEAWFEGLERLDPLERPLSIEARRAGSWTHIGSCGLNKHDRRAGTAQLGIVIGDKNFWDQGFGTDAVQTLLDFAFGTINVHKVHLRVFTFNRRAIQVYERVGFVEEGRLREQHYHDGAYHDVLLMGVLRGEWEERKGSGS